MFAYVCIHYTHTRASTRKYQRERFTLTHLFTCFQPVCAVDSFASQPSPRDPSKEVEHSVQVGCAYQAEQVAPRKACL